MPLPPAPTKRAALLSPEAFEAPARGKPRSGRKTSASFDGPEPAAKAQARDMFEHGGGLGVEALAPPAAPVVSVRQAARPAAASDRPQAKTRPKRTTPTGPTKLFVLDTNVLLHDPMCLFRFEEHDIFLPM
ncbi:MAG: PhoH family protein, partial [Burkholderiales bacterium]|nr:PhoH family protein [Burkholderiales bacterium]